MNTTSSHDAAQARAALEQASNAELTTDRDRRVHGLATAGFGLVMGLYVAAYRLADGHGSVEGALMGLYVVTLLGLAAWQKRAAGTVPRNARSIGYLGLAASAALMIVSVIWLNVRQGDARTAGLPDQVDAWWVYVVAAVVTALPTLVAGHLIRRAPRR